MMHVITFAMPSVLPRNAWNGSSGDSAVCSITTNAVASAPEATSNVTVAGVPQPSCVARVSA